MLNQLASFIAETDYGQLPRALTVQAKRHFLDTLGASLAGSDSPVWRECLSLVREEGGHATAVVWGSQYQATPRQAAWLNGVAAHMYELDDTGGCDHSGAVVIPAMLAVLPLVSRPVSGKELITAMVIGYDIGRRVLEACGGYSPHNGAGWHSTATCGVFGAAAAACALLKLSPQQCASALGIAASFSGGLWSFIHDGSQTKKLHAARAAEGGVQAALLAQRGVSGPAAIFEPLWGGFLQTMAAETQQPEALVADLGQVWKLARCSIKPYASCRGTHSAIDALDEILQQHDLQPGDIERITVGLNPFLQDMTGTRDLQSLAAAQMSLPYALTARALYGTAGLSGYDDQKRLAPEAADFMARVVLEIDPQQGRDEEPWVRVDTRQGERWQHHVAIASGAPANPLSQQALIGKYRSLASRVLPENQVAALEVLCDGLEDVTDCQEITRLLAC
ncbi:MmgE/PrpD family protein [Tatumella citrea]|uniref:2-methylcitrate dehydratase n=1 Tax=Tatumella citrea TaxID=53336 RepID=A0A1Y0LLX5_TATCI|nr:MmgE/PrpD family protein [Tatumella citrea]ARU94469.1 2-methylcitrate dehydratase [Tatumella citrea]ARU98508.1 2-methylcitrate dehydratase [Tatumella citrea]